MGFVLLIALLAAASPFVTEKTGLAKRFPLGMKMLCACMYLLVGVAACLCAEAYTMYSLLLLIGLLAGFAGDFLLSCRQGKYFYAGVLFFALGHILYSFTFLGLGALPSWKDLPVPVLVCLFLFAVLLFVLHRTGIQLQKNQIPLLLYAAVLLFSFTCALTRGVLSLQSNLPFGLCLATGGLLFVVSDIFLGLRMLHVKLPECTRHVVGYTYFPAQTLLAISIFFV